MKTNHHDHCFYVESLNILNDPFADKSPVLGVQKHSNAVEDHSRGPFPALSE